MSLEEREKILKEIHLGRIDGFYSCCRKDFILFLQRKVGREHQDIIEESVDDAFLKFYNRIDIFKGNSWGELMNYFTKAVYHCFCNINRNQNKHMIKGKYVNNLKPEMFITDGDENFTNLFYDTPDFDFNIDYEDFKNICKKILTKIELKTLNLKLDGNSYDDIVKKAKITKHGARANYAHASKKILNYYSNL